MRTRPQASPCRRVGGLLLALASLVWGQQRELKPGFNLFSKQQDIQLGREGASQIERQVTLARNAELNDYVVRIGRRLASQPQADQYPYSFKVVHDSNINAFALPGGPTYINTGLIAAAENEGQLAGVMAHEIGHVALRHGTNQASKANLIQLPALLAGALLGDGSLAGQLAQLGVHFGAGSLLLKYSRNAERDADLLGARMMSHAGYNPLEMARFFEKLEGEGAHRGAVAQFFASHPNPGNRSKAVQEEIRYLPRRAYDADSGQFARARQMVNDLPAAPKRGAAASIQDLPAGRPSGRFRQYRGREFAFSHPDNWQTYGDRDSAMLTVAPREGLRQSRDGRMLIGYGVMVSFYFPQRGGRVDLRRHTEELLRKLQQENPGMRVSSEGSRRLTVGGEAAMQTTLHSESIFAGEAEVDLLVTVQRPEGLFYMIFIAPEREYREIRDTFEQMLRSVQFAA